MKNKNILIFAPHADDEVIGCGGIIDKYRHDNNVYIVYCTTFPTFEQWTGADKIEKSYNFNIEYYGFEDQSLDTIRRSVIIDKMRKSIIREYDYVFLPYIHDANTDHKIIAECGMIVTRAYDSKVKNVLMYEIPETTMLASIPFNPNYFVEIDIENKIEILKNYGDVIKDDGYHPRSYDYLMECGKVNAVKSGIKTHAEAFQIVRMIEES